MNPLRQFVRKLRQWLDGNSVKNPISKNKPQIETLEDRSVPAAFGFRTIDGSGNNLANPSWGTVGVDYIRLARSEYADGVSAPAGADRPSARLISNTLADQGTTDTTNERMMSAMMYAWGQFIDHDLDLTNTQAGQSFPIQVPTGDPYFDPNSTGSKTIPLTRSVSNPATGVNGLPRQQFNSITAWLDGSMIYGSDATTAASLRTFSGGQLKTSTGNLLPTDATGFFQAGDVRANENPELLSLQTLFVREHNRLADKFARTNPRLTDEQLYQAAREMVIAEVQVITYREWLPTLLGGNALAPYRGYNSNVNPGISNEFATAAFRFGHSMLGDDIEFLNNDGTEAAPGVTLAEAFFNPNLVKTNGIDSLLKYLSSDPSSEIDLKVVNSVRNFLFGPPGAGGLDLASLNIQRGRDHGLADYNDTRAALGLPRVRSFADITSNVEVQEKLRQLYGTVDNIDLWVGGLAEDHVRGASVGPTFRAIIADQFTRTRDADRFWYQRVFSGRELRELENTTLSDIIHRNTSLTTIQKNAFVFQTSISGTLFTDANRDGKFNPGEPVLANKLVELVNTDDGEVVAQKLTDSKGSYSFDVLDGLRTGHYQVRQVLPSDSTGSGSASKSVTIVGGDLFAKGVDIAITPPSNKTLTPPPSKQPQMTPESSSKQENGHKPQGNVTFRSNGNVVRIGGAGQNPAIFDGLNRLA